MSVIRGLISNYDCIAWVPTIRGALSLDLVDKAKNILGDVDKYAVSIKNYNGLRSTRYIAATSLLTVNDSKYAKKYTRSFRYCFYGNIESEGANKDLLTGFLYIVAEPSHCLSEREVTMLNNFKQLTKLKSEYLVQERVMAASMAELSVLRDDLVSKWNTIKENIEDFANDQEFIRTTFAFKVCMSRDGILLLKDVTKEEFRSYFAERNTKDDYEQNVPVHRLFKCAMNFVKYLFHTNYHHDIDHDRLLPASNIHPWKNVGDNAGYINIFNHQLDALMAPITEEKRRGHSEYTINANGVFYYAKSLAVVYKNNELITSDQADSALKFLEIQEAEHNMMTSTDKSIFVSLAAQNNIYFIITAILAFVVSMLKIFTTFVQWEHIDFAKLNKDLLITDFLILLGLVVIGAAFLLGSRAFILRKKFRCKQPKSYCFFQNSNIEKKKYHWAYELWLWLNVVKMWLAPKIYNVLRTLMWAVLLIILLGVIIWIYANKAGIFTI